VIVCIPVDKNGQVDPRWGRADRIAIANLVKDQITNWNEIDVSWSTLHDEGTPARHHARVAKFLLSNSVELVVANHVGDGMVRMLETMHLPIELGASGDAREAVIAAGRKTALP
jgi:predicted Fe-Mo cluster-binding NifX family protein